MSSLFSLRYLKLPSGGAVQAIGNVSLKHQEVDQARGHIDKFRQIDEVVGMGELPWEKEIKKRADKNPMFIENRERQVQKEPERNPREVRGQPGEYDTAESGGESVA